MRFTPGALALLFLISAGLWLAHRPTPDQVWDVVFMGLPSSLSPKDIEIAPIGYLLNQTHRPLFNRNEDGGFTSEVLSKWVQDRTAKQILLCPKSGLRIGEKTVFDAPALAQFLAVRLSELQLHPEIAERENCVELTFKDDRHDFFNLFTHFENAPTWAATNGRFQNGLGEFYVADVTQDKIELKRKSPSREGFTSIIVHAYVGQAALDELTQKTRVEDINRVSMELVPENIKRDYANYGVVLLQTGVLLLHIKDRATRHVIYNCLDLDKFRQAFAPGQPSFKNIKSILPIGVPGAKDGRPEQKCDLAALKSPKSVKFWNWKDNNRETLKAFWADFAKTTGIPIEYSDIKPEKLYAVAMREEKNHELLVMGLSATEFHYRDFYQYIVDPKHDVFPHTRLDMSAELQKLDKNPEQQELQQGIDIIDNAIAKEAIALPLFQQVRQFYFPKNLKGMNFGSNFLEHPIVAEISN